MKIRIIPLLISFLIISGFVSYKKEYSIKVKVKSCSGYKMVYSDLIYLQKNSMILDSVKTLKYSDFLSFMGFSGWVKNHTFKFKKLPPGEYQLKYNCLFNVDTLIPITIINKDYDVDICFDLLPKSKYSELTALDKLVENDKLFVDCYIASAGEFGGYDEGLWITKTRDSLSGQFFSLANTYLLGTDQEKIFNFYVQNETNAKPISQKFEITKDIKNLIDHFLIEIKYFKLEKGFSNAPEHFTIYSKTDTIKKIKHSFDYKPYLRLKKYILERIKT